MGALELWQGVHREAGPQRTTWARAIRAQLDASKLTIGTWYNPCPDLVRAIFRTADVEALKLYTRFSGPLAECGEIQMPAAWLRDRKEPLPRDELAMRRFLLSHKLMKAYNEYEYESSSTLTWAAKVGDLEFTRMLLEADPKMVDSSPKNGCTALALAATRDDQAMVALLLEYKADRNKQFVLSNECGTLAEPVTVTPGAARVIDLSISPRMRKALKAI